MNKRKDGSELIKGICFTLDELTLIKCHIEMEIGQDKAFEGMFGDSWEDDEYAEKVAKSIVKKIKDVV